MTATATVPNHRIGARNKNLLREIILMVDRDSRDYAREIANAITLGIAHEIALYYIDNNANLNSLTGKPSLIDWQRQPETWRRNFKLESTES